MPIKLAPQVAQGDKLKQRKLHDLMILLAGSFVSNEELRKVLEVNMISLENNSAVEVLADIGRNQEKESIAINMIREGDEYTKIARNTGLSLEKIEELAKRLLVRA